MKSITKFWKDKTAIAGSLGLVITAATVLVILAVVLELGPVIGYQTSNAVSIPTTSSWSSANNSAITNGSELWQQNTPMISVTTIAIFAGLIIAVLLTIVGNRGGGQGGSGI